MGERERNIIDWRGRERERERETDRQTDRQRQSEGGERERQSEGGERDGHREGRERDREIQRETEREWGMGEEGTLNGKIFLCVGLDIW